MAQTPFVWGSGGRRLTPEEIAVERRTAALLGQEAMSTAPVGHWSAGLNRVAQGLMSGYDSFSADQASRQNGAESSSVLSSILASMNGGGVPATATAPAAMPAVAPAAVPTGDNATVIRAGLLQRGLPEHVADGFLLNFKDESSLNPNLNEAAPIVPGSRGGFGLAQWTGPRRVGLEQFAAAKGAPVSDINLQLDYLSNELKGPEAAAAQKIMATATPGDAAAAIAKSFLRPAPEHLARRVAAYTAGGDGATLPSGATPAEGYAIPGQAAAPAMPAINPAIIKALSSPYVDANTKSIAGLLLRSQLEQQQAQNKVSTVDLGNAIGVMDARGNLVRQLPKGEPNKGPTYGVVGKDEYGNERYGWIDPRSQTVTPQPSAAPAQPSSIPAAPPGVDPKVWRESHSKRATEEAMPASSDTTSKLRNEIQGLPSYKNIAQAAPVYKSMFEAAGRDTRAADVNMIYGMAKIMDPGSVVRESEMTVAQAISTLPQQLRATVQSQLTGDGRLTPDVRAAIMQEARSRMLAYQGMFDQDAGMYRGIATRGRMNTEDVIPSFGTFDEYKPAAPAAPAGQPIVIDGYKIKAR